MADDEIVADQQSAIISLASLRNQNKAVQEYLQCSV